MNSQLDKGAGHLHLSFGEGMKEVCPSMSEEEKMPETVDITALADDELDDIVGGHGIAVPDLKEPG
jgi:hypothetical protein